MGSLYVALIHYPVYDKNRDVVTSAVTNMDVHDIARSCRTYAAAGFYVVTPVDALRGLVRRIIHHWEEGEGRYYNPTRAEALALVHLEASLEGVEIDIERRHGRLPRLVSTSARRRPQPSGAATFGRPVTYDDLRVLVDGPGSTAGEHRDDPWLLLLGTGWGLTEEVLDRCHYALAPLYGPAAYNHLSVRAAAAIILDRLRCPR